MSGDERPDLGGGEPWTSVDRWIAEGRVDEAARMRARQGWLREQAASSTTFVAVLADLADRGRPVMMQSAAGSRHRGSIAALGADFVALATDHGALVMLRHGSVSAVRTEPGDPPMRSMRAPDLGITLAEVMVDLAAERTRVTVTTSAAEHLAGELLSVGIDLVTLRLDGDARATVYVPFDAVVEVTRPGR